MFGRAAVAGALLAAGLVQADEPVPVRVAVGKTFNVCAAKLIVCPASNLICDDPKIAVMENGPQGAVVEGVAPGTTLCSAHGPGNAFFVLMRVTVTP